jgi:hypothetical protein
MYNENIIYIVYWGCLNFARVNSQIKPQMTYIYILFIRFIESCHLFIFGFKFKISNFSLYVLPQLKTNKYLISEGGRIYF